MLNSLHIRNYAIIDVLEINFNQGFSVITGETGAGKSILLGALGLIQGNRADVQVLRDKDKKCVVEASFEISKLSLNSFFQDNELDYEDVTIIRREISPSAKSRAFINDTPVAVNVLKELVEQLIDIHSQHQTLSLNNSDFQLSIVDGFAQHTALLNDYKQSYNSYKSVSKELQELVTLEQENKKELDFIQFQFDELAEANLINGEQEELEAEFQKAENLETLKSNLNEANQLLQESESNVISNLNKLQSAIGNIQNFDPLLKELAERVSSNYLDLKDIANEIDAFSANLEVNPARLELVEERLNVIYKLQKKHQVQSVEELLLLKDSFDEKLNSMASIEDKILELNTLKEEQYKKAAELANTISKNRKAVVEKIETQIKESLSKLAMPDAELKVEILPLSEINETGLDKIQFLFKSNKGGSFNLLNKVASGGELSRLMLCIKASVARLMNLPTIIFDEIDMGISGDVASKLGQILKETAQYLQIFSITHLPQVAGKGDYHYRVYKENTEHSTHSRLKLLNENERIEEIAKMVSGEKLGEAAIKHAKDLLVG